MIPISIAHEYVIIQQDDYHRIVFEKEGTVRKQLRGQQGPGMYFWHEATDKEFGTRMTPAEFDELTAFVRRFFFVEKEGT